MITFQRPYLLLPNTSFPAKAVSNSRSLPSQLHKNWGADLKIHHLLSWNLVLLGIEPSSPTGQTAPAFMVVPVFGIKGPYNRIAAGCSLPLCVTSCGVSHSSPYLGCQHGGTGAGLCAQASLKHTMMFHSLQCLWGCYSNYLESIHELVTCRCSLFLTLWGLHAHELLASSFNYTSRGLSPTNFTKAIGAHRCHLTRALP